MPTIPAVIKARYAVAGLIAGSTVATGVITGALVGSNLITAASSAPAVTVDPGVNTGISNTGSFDDDNDDEHEHGTVSSNNSTPTNTANSNPQTGGFTQTGGVSAGSGAGQTNTRGS